MLESVQTKKRESNQMKIDGQNDYNYAKSEPLFVFRRRRSSIIVNHKIK